MQTRVSQSKPKRKVITAFSDESEVEHEVLSLKIRAYSIVFRLQL